MGGFKVLPKRAGRLRWHSWLALHATRLGAVGIAAGGKVEPSFLFQTARSVRAGGPLTVRFQGRGFALNVAICITQLEDVTFAVAL
jgi:hypothetical protein